MRRVVPFLPGGKLPCASGTYGAQGAGTRGPYAQYGAQGPGTCMCLSTEAEAMIVAHRLCSSGES